MGGTGVTTGSMDLHCYETVIQEEDRAALWVLTNHSLVCSDDVFLVMPKKQKIGKDGEYVTTPTSDDNASTSAAERLRCDVDAMGHLLRAVHRELRKEMEERAEEAGYLHRRIQELDRQVNHFKGRSEMLSNYSCELEGRLEAMEALVSNVVSLGRPEIDALEDSASALRATGEYDMTDIDRIFSEMETDEELDFEEFFHGLEQVLEDL